MEFISVEEFKKQSEKVQETLLNWWKENVEKHDIFYRKFKDERQKYIVTKVKGYKLETITLRNKNRMAAGRDATTEGWNIKCIWDIVPLFTEGQLRKLIEEKTNGHVDCAYYAYKNNGFRGYTIELWLYSPYKCIKQFKDLGDDLLQAYWQVACKIAEDI